MTVYDPLFIQFLYFFNVERDFFECHEVMEALWLEEGRDPLYQGLLQVAVGLYHHENNNVNGAIKLLTAALEKLAGQPDSLLGINLRQLIDESKLYLDKLKQGSPFNPYSFQIIIECANLSQLVRETTIEFTD